MRFENQQKPAVAPKRTDLLVPREATPAAISAVILEHCLARRGVGASEWIADMRALGARSEFEFWREVARSNPSAVLSHHVRCSGLVEQQSHRPVLPVYGDGLHLAVVPLIAMICEGVCTSGHLVKLILARGRDVREIDSGDLLVGAAEHASGPR